MVWTESNGCWRLMDGGWFVAQVVRHSDGWRGFLNRSGAEVPGAPFQTLKAAQAAVVGAVGGGDQLGAEA